MNSGRIEEDDPRRVHLTSRVKDWVHRTLESLIAAAAGTESNQDRAPPSASVLVNWIECGFTIGLKSLPMRQEIRPMA